VKKQNISKKNGPKMKSKDQRLHIHLPKIEENTMRNKYDFIHWTEMLIFKCILSVVSIVVVILFAIYEIYSLIRFLRHSL
jgi:hypothetical protein